MIATGGEGRDPAGPMWVGENGTLTGVRPIVINTHWVNPPIDQFMRRLPPKFVLGGRVVHKEAKSKCVASKRARSLGERDGAILQGRFSMGGGKGSIVLVPTRGPTRDARTVSPDSGID